MTTTPPGPPTPPRTPEEQAKDLEYSKMMKKLWEEISGAKQKSDYLDRQMRDTIKEAKQDLDAYNEGLEKQKEIQAEIANLRMIDPTNVTKLSELEEELGKLEQQLKDLKKYTEEDMLGNFFGDSFKSNAKDFKSFMGDATSKLTSLGNTLKMGGFEKLGGKIGNAGKALGEWSSNLSGASMAVAAILVASAKFALELDNLSKKIGSATGFGSQFNKTLRDGYESTMRSGVSMEEYANSIINLASSYSAFDPSNKKMIRSLADTSTRLEKLGVNASTSSKMMDHFTRAQGMTAQQAADTTAQIALMGKAIGVTATKMAQDFESASGRLAIYGDKNIKVFKQLTAQAKATGMEVSTLLSISQKFDTFDSAAGSIGQLNAVLGTNLSTLEMMNANDAERVQMMKDQIKMSVGSFDSLDKFTKMYVAQAMGVKDVAEAQRMLNMSNAEAQKYQKQQKEQADIQKELADRTAELVPLMEQLKVAGMKIFMVFKPIIAGFTGIIFIISKLIDGLGWIYTKIEEFIGIGDKLKMILGIIAIAILAITWPVSSVVLAVTGLVAAFGLFWDALHWSGSPLFYEMPGILAKSFSSIGEAVSNTAKKILNFVSNPLGALWDAFHWSGSPELWELPGIFADQIVRIADAITGTINAVNGFAETLIKMASIDYKGFVAIRTDGGSTSMIMGSEDVVTSLNKGKLTVDVKMPEIKLPDIQVKVYIGNKELKEIIRTEVTSIVGKAG